MPNPLLGLLFHWIGGLASASFYVPYKGVRRWSWEIFWLTGGLFSWVVAPWLFAFVQTNDLIGVLSRTAPATLFWCYLFGALWGLGGLTFGLTMRYLGVSLGMAIALGLTTTFGTLVPPLFDGSFMTKLFGSTSGLAISLGILVTVAGIVVVAIAGKRKDAELSPEQRMASIAEFDFRRGLMIAIFSGIMSSCFAYGLAAGDSIRAASLAAGTGVLWQGLPVLCVVLAGGFTTNALWCAWLIARNRSAGQWLGHFADGSRAGSGLLWRNLLLCIAAGLSWYFQFFFYTMGESQMGPYGFSSWTLHMASIIIFATLWGFALGEWKASSGRIKAIIWSGIALLVLATLIIGMGNYLSVG